MKLYDKGQIEHTQYPVDIAMPFGVSSGIVARRCNECDKIFFVNDEDFTKCRSCITD